MAGRVRREGVQGPECFEVVIDYDTVTSVLIVYMIVGEIAPSRGRLPPPSQQPMLGATERGFSRQHVGAKCTATQTPLRTTQDAKVRAEHTPTTGPGL